MPDYTIAPEIFTRYPGYTRGIILASGVTNRPSPPDLIALLRDAENTLRQQLTMEQLPTHPRLVAWREAYRSFGAKPSEFRSSIEALARRVLKDQAIPSINALVDIGNILSLKYLIAAGCHAVDQVKDSLMLRPATGTEDFQAFGSELHEHPEPGEIIFAEGEIVLTRRWSWRQAQHTLTELSTTAVEYNLDGLPPVTGAELKPISTEARHLITHYCGGRTHYTLLTADNPTLEFSIEH